MENCSKEYVAAYLTRLYCEHYSYNVSQIMIENTFKDFYNVIKEVSNGGKEKSNI